MPPSLPRSSLSSLCKSCSSSRAFATTSSLSKIGPESPRFIDIPQPPQQTAYSPRDIKGKLPPPRDLFPNRGVDKTDPEYFALTAPEPQQVSEPQNDYMAWKRQMAETRRTNLREGLLALHMRKVKQQEAIARQSASKQKVREKRFNARIRKDERLTSPTITALNSTLQKGHLPDPEREARLIEKAARVAAKETARAEARKDALHTLYMHARSFITTEEQLNAKIEEIFVQHPWKEVGQGNEENIWDALGAPPTVQDMLSTVNKTQKTAVDFHKGPSKITGERMKRIAEELTGGKMD